MTQQQQLNQSEPQYKRVDQTPLREDQILDSMYRREQQNKQKPNYIYLLTKKNFILTIQNPKNLIFLFITPFILSLFLFFFQRLAVNVSSQSFIYNPQIPTINFPACTGKGCTSIVAKFMTSPTNSTIPLWVNSTLSYISSQTSINVDINSAQSKKYITSMADWEDYRLSLTGSGANKTQIGILFCIDSADFILSTICNSSSPITYFLIINKTDSFSTIFAAQSIPIMKDPVSFSLKSIIDNGILNYYDNGQSGATYPRMKYTTEQFPVVPNRFIQNFDIITQTGAFYYLITPLFAFLFIQSEIVRQKQHRLRQGLNVFGAPHYAYWISWFLISVLYSLVCAVASFLAGFAFRFKFFTDTPFQIIMLFIFAFTLSMQFFSYFIATCCPNLKTANSVSYGLVLLAIVIESFITNNTFLQFIFIDNASTLIVFLKYVLTLYPPFSFTKIFTSITQFSGYHYDFILNYWVPGPGYTWKIFNQTTKGPTVTGSSYTQYSSSLSLLVLVGDAVLYGLLAFYFDNILESNRGRSQSFLFFLTPSYWGFRRVHKKSKITLQDLRNPNFNIRNDEESVNKQRLRVLKNSNSGQPALGMRIKSLSKTFTEFFSKNKVQALKNLTLQIQPNQLMSILGHNGAGKTTLINIMTGILSPDYDDELEIVINNKNINRMNQIRKYIGVCPQFDILWKQLTAQDHLRLFGQLKGIPVDILDDKINQILHFVSLLSEKKAKVDSFSGGMKRRLSLAVAAIGNPKIIFLDQPTTGLDPKVRQQVWTLIQKLKRHKSVILTTHSMEEADILSDRISILVKGRLKCIGNSIYLKECYGSGYRIAINVVQNKIQQLMRYIKKLFPQVALVDSNGGNLLIGIKEYRNLIELIKMLESKQSNGLDEYNMKQLIKDWNVSHTTLEEVFMKVNKERQQ